MAKCSAKSPSGGLNQGLKLSGTRGTLHALICVVYFIGRGLPKLVFVGVVCSIVNEPLPVFLCYLCVRFGNLMPEFPECAEKAAPTLLLRLGRLRLNACWFGRLLAELWFPML